MVFKEPFKYFQYLISTFVICFLGLIFLRKFTLLKNMGEIDTKPIESVQTALSLFGERSDHQRKNRSTSSDDEKDRELKNVLNDLANHKVQLEAKDAAHMQALLNLEQTQKSVRELSIQLKKNEIDKFEMLFKKDVEIEFTKTALLAAQERIEETRREIESVMELENQVLSKTILVDTIVLRLQEASEELSLSRKSHLDSIAELKLAREELEVKKRENSSQEALVEAFKTETSELKLQLKSSEDSASDLRKDVEILTNDLQKAKAEIGHEIKMAKKSEREEENPKLELDSTNDMKDSSEEVERLRMELEIAMAKVGELRNRAEQATCRAEMAEKAKTAIEGQLRKWREDRQKKKIALASLREVSHEPKNFEICVEDEKSQQPRYYQPLYKVLKMKF